MEKYIIAFIMFLMVSLIVVLPFNILFAGFAAVYSGSFIWGIILVSIGCIILRLIKPISIITGKDYKVF